MPTCINNNNKKQLHRRLSFQVCMKWVKWWHNLHFWLNFPFQGAVCNSVVKRPVTSVPSLYYKWKRHGTRFFKVPVVPRTRSTRFLTRRAVLFPRRGKPGRNRENLVQKLNLQFNTEYHEMCQGLDALIKSRSLLGMGIVKVLTVLLLLSILLIDPVL